MQWRISSAKSLGIDYIGDAETAPIGEAVQELWEKYIEDSAPKNSAIAWDHLRVELWLDSGRIILYPASCPFRLRIEKSACQMTCPDVLESFNAMSDSNTSDDEFEHWAKATEARVADLVSKAANRADLPKRLSRPAVRVSYYAYSGEEGPIREDILVN